MQPSAAVQQEALQPYEANAQVTTQAAIPQQPQLPFQLTQSIQSSAINANIDKQPDRHQHQHQQQEQEQEHPSTQKDKAQVAQLTDRQHKICPAAVVEQRHSVIATHSQSEPSLALPLKRSPASGQISFASAADASNATERATEFDDAAENFCINYPADSAQQLLPLSESVPLLTDIEATVVDKQRAIRVSKNSSSLIFTRKDLSTSTCSLGGSLSRSTYGAAERPRKHSKHFPRNSQQRCSLQIFSSQSAQTAVTFTATATATATASASASDSQPTENNDQFGGNSKTVQKAHSLQTSPGAGPTAAAPRKHQAYSWYAPVYSALEEELEQDLSSRDSSPIRNLANTKQQQSTNRLQQRRSSQSGTNASGSGSGNDTETDIETVALLETRKAINVSAEIGCAPVQRDADAGDHKLQAPAQGQPKKRYSVPSSLALQQQAVSVATAEYNSNGNANGIGGTATTAAAQDTEGSLGLAGGQLPRRRRLENFIKSLVGLKGSSNTARDSSTVSNISPTRRPVSPEIRITRTPSEQELVLRDPGGRQLANGNGGGGSTSSLNIVQQKIWHMVRREGSATSLHQEKSQSIVQYMGMRKCETVLALTRHSHTHGLGHTLSTPSDTSTAATAGSTGSGIFSASGVEQIRPINRLRNSSTSINAGTCSRCSSILSLAASGSRYSLANSFISSSAALPPRPDSVQSTVSTQAVQRRPSVTFSTTVDVINIDSTPTDEELQPQPHPHIDVNAQIRQSEHITAINSTGDNKKRAEQRDKTDKGKSSSKSFGAERNRISSQNSLPQVTTATLHSNNNNYITATGLTPSFIDMGDFGTNHDYPLTVNTLLSMATANHLASRCIVRDGITLRHCDMMDPADVTPSDDTPIVSDDTTDCANTENAHEKDKENTISSSSTSSSTTTTTNTVISSSPVALPFHIFTCKLCLVDVERAEEATTLQLCSCKFCTECMRAYVDFEILEGAYEISCPDAKCLAQGVITLSEMEKLTTANLLKKHHRYRLNREIELDKSRTWCPRAGCETICQVGSGVPEHSAICQIDESPSTSGNSSGHITHVDKSGLSISVLCPSCKDEFCALCKKAYHPNVSCDEFSRRLIADGQDDIGIPFDSELIKCCPMCAVPIEKDEGCAQMMCKRCKHVFCWYCLASLDDDFLLRHYDKGPCKNKLGHSRASVVWHRAQVIGIFAGFGILLLVASPLLLLAAPCIICCKCRSCGGSKVDEVELELEEEATALQG